MCNVFNVARDWSVLSIMIIVLLILLASAIVIILLITGVPGKLNLQSFP